MMSVVELNKRSHQIVPSLKRLKPKLRIVTMEETRIIDKSKINYLKSDSNYCEIHMLDGSQVCCSVTMKSIFAKLDTNAFFKTHASYVVNIDQIVSVSARYVELVLESGHKIPVARSKKLELKQQMERWCD